MSSRDLLAENDEQYHFKERVKRLMQRKKLSKKGAEQITHTVIAEKETIYNYTVFPTASGKYELTCMLCHKSKQYVNRTNAILMGESHMLDRHPKVKAAIDRSWEDSLDKEAPRVTVNNKGEARFRQGDISFIVDSHDLNKVVGCNGETSPLNHLMDSQLSQLARMNGLTVVPFNRELIMSVLVGILQMTWYRDLENHESEHLRSNQANRVTKYYNDLAAYVRNGNRVKEVKDSSGERTSQPRQRNTDLSQVFELVKGDYSAVAKGRESALLEVMQKVKRGTLAQIVSAAQDSSFKTKQNFEQQIIRFLRELVAHGAISEVKA